MTGPVQIASIILPRVWVTGVEVETVNNLVAHVSIDIPVEHLQEKTIHVIAIETITAGVPGNLWVWVELSPVNTVTSALYWAAIGGGGGAFPPAAPAILVPTGVNNAVHSLALPWTIHSPFARLVVQMPVAAAPLTAFWRVQAIVDGKG